ncbi:Magnesium transporter MRS2-F [Asimina triloba]
MCPPSSVDDFARIQAPQTHPSRRKCASTRIWLVVCSSGKSYVEEVGKHSIMSRTGLPARDLRVLDPMLSYTSTILGRERAIVINLEHIKAIITATEVLVLNSKDPMVAPFIQELQCRISSSYGIANPIIASHNGITPPATTNGNTETENITKDTWGSPAPVSGGPKMLPFEFRALEVCLESTCKCLELETSTLEQEAYPALDELTSKVNTLTLERVRQIKSRLVVLSGRVQKVRDELEHLLDDDMDMAEMYLTDKLAQRPLDETSSRDELDDDEFELTNERDEDSKSKCRSFNESSVLVKPDIQELEMLLEAYFVQMREYVDDTEDYINILLDDKQNQLLQMGVMLSTANMIFNAGIVVVGLFGMNIHISLFDSTPTQFWETTLGTGFLRASRRRPRAHASFYFPSDSPHRRQINGAEPVLACLKEEAREQAAAFFSD